jgi:phosphohistidine phosphatase SixA
VISLLLRHGPAGSPSAWNGEDLLRPLDPVGRALAARLPEDLAGFPLRRVLSSPAVRCVQTLAPLAVNRGLVVERRPELAEGADPASVVELLRGVAEPAALCTHGDVLYALTGSEPEKGAAVVVSLEPEELRILDVIPPRDVS